MSHFDNEFSKYHPWREWSYLGSDRLESLRYRATPPIAPKHGVYLIRACIKVSRIESASDIIYIGQSGGGPRKGEQGIGPNNGKSGRLYNVRGLDKWIRHQLENKFQDRMFKLQCYFTNGNEDPLVIEKQLLAAYIKDHLEPPPGNGQCSLDDLLNIN